MEYSRFLRQLASLAVLVSLALGWGCKEQSSNAGPAAGEPYSASSNKGDSTSSKVIEPVPSAVMQQRELVKNRDEDWERRANELGNELGPKTREMRRALLTAKWDEVLRLTEELSTAWNESGLVEMSYAQERAEALIGLGRPAEALTLIDPNPRHRDTAANHTMALAMAQLGELDSASARNFVKLSLRFSGVEAEQLLPSSQTLDEREACIRTARALEVGAGGSRELDEYIIREAQEALRLDPNQMLAAYACAKALNRQKRYAEALSYWQTAAGLPGSLGEKAAVMAANTEHVLRNAPPP